MTNSFGNTPTPETYYLPELTPPAAAGVIGEVARSGWETCRTRALLDMERNNPVLLYRATGLMAQGIATTPETQQASIGVVLMTHQLLAEQARLDDPAGQDPSRYRLPEVSEDIVMAIRADIAELGAQAIVADMKAVETENPLLVATVREFLASHLWSLFVGENAMRTTHLFLKRQARADAMRRLILGSPPDQP